MAWGFTAIAGATLVSAYMGKEAAEDASAAGAAAGEAQAGAADRGVEEVRRQFDEVQKLMKPYVDAGEKGLGGMMDLIGLNGPEAMQAAIAGIESSPEFAALTEQGETALLANASATGGLRGGNTQGALAQFRPALLSQLINERFSRLGGITQLGQASAAGQAAAGQATGQQVSDLYQQQGAAIAGGLLAGGNAQAQYKIGVGNQIGQTLGTLGTLRLLKKF
jgi:hypothetical protein